MRASKENAEKAIQAVHKTMPPGMPKDLTMEFLKAAKAKLPTEKAYDDDAERRKFKFKAGDRVDWTEEGNEGLGTVKNVDFTTIYVDWDDDAPNDPISRETFLKYARKV